MQQDDKASTIESAIIKHKRRISPFWLLPFVAILIAGWLIYSDYQNRGTTVTIHFQSAAGIIPGRTPVRYQGVDIGIVKSITLSKDLRTISVDVSINRQLESSLRKGTQFWLVTPKASLAGVSGLDALVGGNYIGMMPGDGELQTTFTALDSQPKYHLDTGELMIHLTADDLGSLSSGSLVYYRKIPVGKVYDYTISPDNNGVLIDVLIDKRFSHLVKENSHFWNVSGIKGDFSLQGASVQLESLAALVNGAIAFDSPHDGQAARTDQQFTLYPDLARSQRGVTLTLDLPSAEGLSAGRTPLMLDGLQVGTLTKLTLVTEKQVSGILTVDPSVVDMMRTNTRIELQSPVINLTSPDISRLLSGATLQLIPGDGVPQTHFQVLNHADNLMRQPGTLVINLKAPQSYGIDSGNPIILHGIKIGQVISRTLNSEGVSFVIVIDPTYRELIHSDSQFIVNSRIDFKLGIDGLKIQGASPKEWLDGGIRILPGKKGAPLSHYPLYSSQTNATENIKGDDYPVTLTLTAASLPEVQTGSVVLYHKFQVGEIINVRPMANEFEVDVYIRPDYRKLLTNESVFWAEGGAKVQLNGNGLSVQAAPLNRALKGAISFDNLAGVQYEKGRKRPLYASETSARAIGSQITLRTYDGSKLSEGMPIRYLGINIGQVESLRLSDRRNAVIVNAVLYPEYVDTFARSGSRFSVISPELSPSGLNNLETLLQPYINVELGNGTTSRVFELQKSTITDSRYLDGLSLVIDAPEVGSLQIGTPVLFRGIEVGTVTGFNLGTLSDRIHVSLRISKRFQHLVRNNSQFWLASGYNVEFGLTGGVVKTGTFQQFIRGGIAFATPPTTPLAPIAETNKHFLLNANEPKGWREWGTAIPAN